MSNEVDDIMTNTQLYGIYSPHNYHSFHNTWTILLFQMCQHCSTRILPLTAACECLRCGAIAHRKCVSSMGQCSFFTFEKPLSQSEMLVSKPSTERRNGRRKSSIPLPSKTAADMHFDSIFELRLEQIIEKACSIPEILEYVPEIKSPFCIWRTLLRAIVIRQTTNLNQIPPFCTTEDSVATIESAVRSLLLDAEHFAGQLFVVCFYVFLSLHVLNTKELIVQHARECLDTIVGGLLCVCSDAILADDRTVRAIVIAVEKVVFSEQNGAFYEKILQFLHREARAMTLRPPRLSTSIAWSERRRAEFGTYAKALQRKRSPKEKLAILVVLLQLIADAAVDRDRESTLYLPEAETETEQPPAGIVGADRERGSSQPSHSDDAVATEEPLIDNPSEKAPSYRREDMNADALLELFAAIIWEQQQSQVCDWITEYLFLSSEVVSEQSVDSVAAEGYALATLQQTMTMLLSEEHS